MTCAPEQVDQVCDRAALVTCAPEQVDQVERLAETLDAADAVLVGAGAGLSTSAGLTYGGERFMRTSPTSTRLRHPRHVRGRLLPLRHA
ncbi:hypothetical protein [Eggerthella sinensis]|uniref:hypothetical protein n=1 Tax=Eggerthella sinensis TaxID=242230 RepID=UPI0022E3B89F|nr:hypothetical protein [Eggerthella sinensis]